MGFYFWNDNAVSLPEDLDFWDAMDEINKEVIIMRTKGRGFCPNFLKFPRAFLSSFGWSSWFE